MCNFELLADCFATYCSKDLLSSEKEHNHFLFTTAWDPMKEPTKGNLEVLFSFVPYDSTSTIFSRIDVRLISGSKRTRIVWMCVCFVPSSLVSGNTLPQAIRNVLSKPRTHTHKPARQPCRWCYCCASHKTFFILNIFRELFAFLGEKISNQAWRECIVCCGIKGRLFVDFYNVNS